MYSNYVYYCETIYDNCMCDCAWGFCMIYNVWYIYFTHDLNYLQGLRENGKCAKITNTFVQHLKFPIFLIKFIKFCRQLIFFSKPEKYKKSFWVLNINTQFARRFSKQNFQKLSYSWKSNVLGKFFMAKFSK